MTLKMHSTLRRGVAAAAAASLAALSAWSPAAAQPAGPNDALPQLGACMAERGALDVVLLIDETGSLVGEFRDGKIDESVLGSDDDHNRIPAAQSFVDELVARQADTNVDIRVRVAGFGEQYKSGATDPANYGDWQELNEGSAERVKGEIENFRTRTTELYTHYGNALEGAYNDFARSTSPNPCRLLVTFTDGELTAPEGPEVVEERICRPSGIADRLRAGEITNVAIGLSMAERPTDYSLMRRLTEGGTPPCGELAPNGAFYEASNVGALFAAFRQAMSPGRDVVSTDSVGTPFEFTLDNSIDAVRFNVIAEENLGPDAHVVLTAPDGSTIDLTGANSGTVAGADVEWTADSEPVQRVSGRLRLPQGAEWAGVWKLGFVGFDPARSEGKVISAVEIQPDLQVRFRGPEGGEQGPLSLIDDQTLTVELVDGAGNVRQMAGDATTTVVFTGSGQEPQELVKDADISSGTIEIPANAIKDIPAAGRLEARTVVTTAGERPTEFSPFLNSQALTIAPQNLPQVLGTVQFNSDTATGAGEVLVKGPGKAWIAPGTTLNAKTLPEGIAQVQVNSEYDSQANALEVPAGETKSLPVTVNVGEPTEGLLNGTVDVAISDLDDTSAPASVPVGVNGAYTVPLDTAKFTGALVAALLAALLIPLLIFYLIRFLTARIPTRRQLGAQVFPMEMEGNTPRFVHGTPELSMEQALATPVGLTSTTFRAAGYEGEVRGFHPNPFADAPVVIKQKPSTSANGNQVADAAALPLALPNTWFVVGSNRGQNAYDVVALLNPGTPLQQLQQMSKDIQSQAPQRVRELHDARVAASDPLDRPGDPAPKRRGRGGKQTPPPPPQPAEPTNRYPAPPEQQGGFGSGGFGSGPTPPPPPPPAGGGFGSGGFGS